MTITPSEQITKISKELCNLSKKEGLLRAVEIVMNEDFVHRDMSKDSFVSLVLMSLQLEADKIGRGE